MKTQRNKIKATAIALLLIVTITSAIFALPLANAHTPKWDIPTWAYVVALPETVGVGQPATIYAFLGNPPPSGATIQNTYRQHNYQIIVTAPDGANTTQFYETVQDTTCAQGYVFNPTKVGTYNVTFNYLGFTITAPRDQPASTSSNSYLNDTYLPSSATCKLFVQQDPIPERPLDLNVLPTDYWTRPIYGMNNNWYTVSSDWLGTGSAVSSLTGSGAITGFSSGSTMERHTGDAIGPETSHIMWTYPVEAGGVVGGNRSYVLGNTYFEGSAYQQRFTNPIIINGRLYYRPPVSFLGPNSGPTVCQDLRTGQILWNRTDIPSLSFGYIYDLHTPNQHGTYPAILFTSNFARAFDAYTGDPLFNVTGVPSGTVAQGPQGEQLRYVIADSDPSPTAVNYTLAQWNSTKMWSGTEFRPDSSGNSPSFDTETTTTWAWVNTTTYINDSRTITSQNVTTSTTAINASYSTGSRNRNDWNVTIPWRNNMTSTPTVLYAFYDNMLICRNGSLPALMGSQTPYTYFAVSLKPQTRGNILWMKTYDPPAGNITLSAGPVDPTVGVFTEGYKETTQWAGYSMTDGSKLWKTNGQNALDYFGNPIYPYVTGQTAFGKLYSSGLGGVLYCYNLTNGNVLWTYGNGGKGNTTQSYFEVPGNYPIFINAVGSNGLIYLVTTEHTIQTPIYKGAEARCINATDGKELWALSDYTGEFGAMSYAIADGYATFYNGYDDQLYSVGRGPSATTVTAPDVATAFGAPVVIKGSVVDVSAGTKQNEQAARFPNGVPVASDASMKEWMGYVYQQQLSPTNFTGVPVTIDVVDSNGNYRNIGTATTDSTGLFHLTWTPDISGDYTVIATFHGTNGYWPSYTETAFTVLPAPEPAPVTTVETPLDMTGTYVTYAAVAIIIAIAIVGAILALLIRKRP